MTVLQIHWYNFLFCVFFFHMTLICQTSFQILYKLFCLKQKIKSNNHDCIFDRDQMHNCVVCYWRTYSDDECWGTCHPQCLWWFQLRCIYLTSKLCSNTENGIVVCWSLEESPDLLWSITTSSGSQLVNTGWAGTISSSESSTQPANKDKMTWKSGKEMHFVMDNIEIWKTTCEPSVLRWTNLHIFTVQLFFLFFKMWIVYSNKGELLMSTSDKRHSIKGAYARVGRDGPLPNIFEMACAGAIWRLKTSLELQWHITK